MDMEVEVEVEVEVEEAHVRQTQKMQLRVANIGRACARRRHMRPQTLRGRFAGISSTAAYLGCAAPPGCK